MKDLLTALIFLGIFLPLCTFIFLFCCGLLVKQAEPIWENVRLGWKGVKWLKKKFIALFRGEVEQEQNGAPVYNRSEPNKVTWDVKDKVWDSALLRPGQTPKLVEYT